MGDTSAKPVLAGLPVDVLGEGKRCGVEGESGHGMLLKLEPMCHGSRAEDVPEVTGRRR